MFMNRISSAPISVLRYDVDKDLLLRSGIQHLSFIVVKENKSQRQELNSLFGCWLVLLYRCLDVIASYCSGISVKMMENYF